MDMLQLMEEIVQSHDYKDLDAYNKHCAELEAQRNNNQTKFYSETKAHPVICESETNKGVGKNSQQNEKPILNPLSNTNVHQEKEVKQFSNSQPHIHFPEINFAFEVEQ